MNSDASSHSRADGWVWSSERVMGMLQAAIALLPDIELSNRLAAAALAAHEASRGRLRWPRLPPHLSLKQPFFAESLAELEHAVERLAGELGVVHATLGAVGVQPPSPGSPEAVVWVGVDAAPALLELEQRLDDALSNAPATAAPSSVTLTPHVVPPFVAEAHRFHVTLGFLPAVSLGPAAVLPALAGTRGTFSELGLFVYDGLLGDGRPRAGWQCMLCARCRLTGPFE